MAALIVRTICALSLLQASVCVFDDVSQAMKYTGIAENYMKQSAQNGTFGDYVENYAKNYYDVAKTYAGKQFKDRIAQAKRYEDEYDRFEQMGNSSAYAEDLAAKALSAQHQALKQAEATIAKIRMLDAKLRADLKNRSWVLEVARGIGVNVMDSFSSHRNEYRHRFDKALEVLDPEALLMANSTDVEKAADSARRVEREFAHVDHVEVKALRAQLRAFEKAGKAKAHGLFEEAKKAARQVYWLGMDSARAQRRAGVQEHLYERIEDSTEDASERLLSHAEAAAERAEDRFEELSDRVAHHLEKITEKLLKSARESRKQRLHHAIDRVYKAREESQRKTSPEEAAQESRRQQAARGKAAKERTTPEEAAAGKAAEEKDMHHGHSEEKSGKGEEASRPTVFLARTSTRHGGSMLSVSAFCVSVAMLAAMTALVLHECRRATVTQHPLLA